MFTIGDRARSGGSRPPATALAAIGIVALCAAVAAAGDPASARSGREKGLLVLNSGRIVEGRISHRTGGYQVEKANGSMLVPFDQVRFQADDLRDAYRKYRKTMPVRTATNHIGLARWCLSQQLPDAARRELRDALQLEPNREDARRMLIRLETNTAPTANELMSFPEPDLFGGRDSRRPEVKSLAGLSHEAASVFVSRIQPLLMNKCGNASCHGTAAENEFRFTPVRRGRAHRGLAEQNLAAALKFVDTGQPDASPLLTKPQGGHGRGGRPVFVGRQGSDQRAMLRQWVRQVAGELAESERQNRRRPTLRSAASDSSGKPDEKMMQLSVRKPPGDQQMLAETKTTGGKQGGKDDQEFLKSLLLEERGDPFDPDEFNRRYGPASGGNR